MVVVGDEERGATYGANDTQWKRMVHYSGRGKGGGGEESSTSEEKVPSMRK